MRCPTLPVEERDLRTSRRDDCDQQVAAAAHADGLLHGRRSRAAAAGCSAPESAAIVRLRERRRNRTPTAEQGTNEDTLGTDTSRPPRRKPDRRFRPWDAGSDSELGAEEKRVGRRPSTDAVRGRFRRNARRGDRASGHDCDGQRRVERSGRQRGAESFSGGVTERGGSRRHRGARVMLACVTTFLASGCCLFVSADAGDVAERRSDRRREQGRHEQNRRSAHANQA